MAVERALTTCPVALARSRHLPYARVAVYFWYVLTAHGRSHSMLLALICGSNAILPMCVASLAYIAPLPIRPPSELELAPGRARHADVD